MNKEFEILGQDEKTVKLTIKIPSNDELDEADKVYAGKVASLIRGNGKRQLLLRSELGDFLKKSGVWTDADEQAIDAINKEIEANLSKLKKGGIKLNEAREIAIKILDLRADIIKVSKKRQLLDDSTVESIAENEKIDYLIYACTVHADSGKNYWESFDDMKEDRSSEAYGKASVNVLQRIYNYDPELEKNLPEIKWLKKFSFVDDEMNYVDRKSGKKVDKTGRFVEDIEKEVKDKYESLQGEIVEETPFIDDETNEPVAAAT